MKDKSKYFFLILTIFFSGCFQNNIKYQNVITTSKKKLVIKTPPKVKKLNNTYKNYTYELSTNYLETSSEIKEILIDKKLSRKKYNTHSNIINKLKNIKLGKSIIFNKKHTYFIFYGSSKLNINFKTKLSNFLPEFIKIIYQHKDIIDEIRIKNYTSSDYRAKSTKRAKFIANTNLSRKRAIKTKKYILSISKVTLKKKQWLKNNIVSYGMGSINLIRNKDFLEDKLKSRRTIVQIIFK